MRQIMTAVNYTAETGIIRTGRYSSEYDLQHIFSRDVRTSAVRQFV